MIKAIQKKRDYHQRVLNEVTHMLRISGNTQVEPKPVNKNDHDWAANKLQQLVKA
jgi:hypothetical protein